MLTAAAVVVCALELLGRSPRSTVPIRFLDHPPPDVSRNAEAFTVHDPDTIVLITATEAFRNAQRGATEPGGRDGCRKLASVIVHEEWHLKHGGDEEGAYLAQLTTLAMLNAPPAMLTSVRKSMMVALANQKSRRIPELVVVRR
jgi:hypothetical protein